MTAAQLPVVVVGAGPAGCATAIALARRGEQVIVLDRARFPRDKICGDVLLPEARELLLDLGLDIDTLCEGKHLIDACCYVTPSGRGVEMPFVDLDDKAAPWWVLRRQIFDDRLMTRARSLGVEVREGWAVQDLIVDNGHIAGIIARVDGSLVRIKAAMVVAADGAGSKVARAAGLAQWHPAHLCLALRAYAPSHNAQSHVFKIFTSRHSLPGCAWIVPTGDGQTNVGVGVLRSGLDRTGLKPRAILDEIAVEHPEFAAAYREVQTLKGWSLPGASLPRQRWRPGLILVGDAAGLIDPFTGHGIHTALWSGLHAADIITTALADNDVGETHLSRYESLWQHRFALEMRLGWILQRLSASPWRVEALLRSVSRSEHLRRRVGGLVGHCYPRTALLSRRWWHRFDDRATRGQA